MPKKERGINVGARRTISYVVLVIFTILCLFWFYVLFINATRSHSELSQGFTFIPSTHAIDNINNVLHDTIPIFYGLLNSLIVSFCTCVLCTYFSTMTAFAIHAYEFKLKKFIFAFILAIGFKTLPSDGYTFSRLALQSYRLQSYNRDTTV